MSSKMQNQYTPDYVSQPGETLMEKLEELGMSQAELAQRMGRPHKTINEIIRGKASITPETALQLEHVLGIPASFWNNRERQYRQHLAQIAEQQCLADQVGWLRRFPVKVMVEMGWIAAFADKAQQVRELMKFFGIASPDQWEVLWGQPAVVFRKAPAFQSEPEAISAWLRRGEIEAQLIQCKPYTVDTFHQALREARRLTIEPPKIFQSQLAELCAGAGVAIVFVPQLPKARVSGATRWLTPEKALIQLSLRYKTDDQLWFTFFHEAGHILLHGKREVFLEDDSIGDEKEREANEFAARILIPPNRMAAFLRASNRGLLRKEDIRTFATALGVAPGIVVGRLQHDGHLPFTHCNDLKRSFTWVTGGSA